MKTYDFSELAESDKKLVDEAAKALKNAYNPFDNLLLGAAVESADGFIMTGANLLVSSTGLNMCAERTALSSAFAQGHSDITKLVLIGGAGFTEKNSIPTPCGTCRQFLQGIVQKITHDIRILCISPDKQKVFETSIAELLPYPYITH